MKKDLLNPHDAFEEESFDDFLQRYNGFGKDIYHLISIQRPDIYDKLIFYKSINLQPEDSYAIYNNGACFFAIQLDPAIEVIVIWNKKEHIEIGSWSENEYKEALDLITKEFMSC